MNRRQFLSRSAGLAALAGASQIPRARAATPGPDDLRFLFVFNNGGWDPTRVFAPEFSNDTVSMEADADRATAGEIRYVASEARPSVTAFMDRWHPDMLVLNGVQVRSIAHEICTMIALTGSTSGSAPDWPALLAAATGDRYTLPHLVLGGPSYPGDLGVAVARAGAVGQLEDLLSGDVLALSDLPVDGIPIQTQSIVDRYLQRRAGARADSARSAVEAALSSDFRDALDKAVSLKDSRYVVDFSSNGGLPDQSSVAVDALASGLSRCVTLGYPGAGGGLGWDTHANNDDQSALYEGLFSGLGQLMALLESAPGAVAERLVDETVVVVLSEMGRTPQLNANGGKDHWPYTSMMLLGPGLTTNRQVGGFDDLYNGERVDLDLGELGGDQVLSAESIGGALLALAGIDPGEHISGSEPLLGVLA